MDRCCENCWRVDTCSTEDKERAADSWDFSCFEAPDNEDLEVEMLREQRWDI